MGLLKRGFGKILAVGAEAIRGEVEQKVDTFVKDKLETPLAVVNVVKEIVEEVKKEE